MVMALVLALFVMRRRSGRWIMRRLNMLILMCGLRLGMPVIMRRLRLRMRMVNVSVFYVVRRMRPPIRMASFPGMETFQPRRVANDPHVAGPQIIILVAHDADIFVTVPNVIVRDHHDRNRRRWVDDYCGRCRRRNDDSWRRHTVKY